MIYYKVPFGSMSWFNHALLVGLEIELHDLIHSASD